MTPICHFWSFISSFVFTLAESRRIALLVKNLSGKILYLCILIPHSENIRMCHWETIFCFRYFKIMVTTWYRKWSLPWNPRACLYLQWPTRVTTHYLTTYFELLSTHFKLCTTHSKFLKTHSKFFETNFKFTINSEISPKHFEIFTTHSPQDPECWQKKRNGYTAPPSSFDAMFCSTCGH